MPGERHDRAGGERGLATVWTAGAVAALLLVATAMFWLGSAIVLRHRAATAADLAALAAAGRAAAGGQAACDRARAVTERMLVRMTSCRLEQWDALVEVESAPPGSLGRLGMARARARAGPVDEPP